MQITHSEFRRHRSVSQNKTLLSSAVDEGVVELLCRIARRHSIKVRAIRFNLQVSWCEALLWSDCVTSVVDIESVRVPTHLNYLIPPLPPDPDPFENELFTPVNWILAFRGGSVCQSSDFVFSHGNHIDEKFSALMKRIR